jgi:hypothetical protein
MVKQEARKPLNHASKPGFLAFCFTLKSSRSQSQAVFQQTVRQFTCYCKRAVVDNKEGCDRSEADSVGVSEYNQVNQSLARERWLAHWTWRYRLRLARITESRKPHQSKPAPLHVEMIGNLPGIVET